MSSKHYSGGQPRECPGNSREPQIDNDRIREQCKEEMKKTRKNPAELMTGMRLFAKVKELKNRSFILHLFLFACFAQGRGKRKKPEKRRRFRIVERLFPFLKSLEIGSHNCGSWDLSFAPDSLATSFETRSRLAESCSL
jgi:hypothetical protein